MDGWIEYQHFGVFLWQLVLVVDGRRYLVDWE
jgi:hypothetical protein